MLPVSARKFSLSPVSLVWTLALSTVIAANPAYAQAGASQTVAITSQSAGSAAPVDDGDIIVTAERRETSLLRTPVSITVVSAKDLQERRIESLNDLATSVPGLAASGGAPQTSLFIRGIGTSDPGSPPSIGVYVDDVYNPRAFGNSLFDLPDVQSVEVLRGPQGTLYGQNSSGGAIKITSRRPSEEFEGSALVEVGNYNSFRGQVYVTGPIIPGLLSASLAYTSRNRDGYVYNETLDYWVEDARSNQLRAKLLFTPADNFEATLSGTVLRDKSDTQSVAPLNYGTGDPYKTYSPRRFDPSRDVDGVSLNAKWDISDSVTLKSITAYRSMSNLNPHDVSGLPTFRSGFIQLLLNDQWSQEFQVLGDIGRLNYIVGAVYRNEVFSLDRNAWTNEAYTQIVSEQTVVDKAIYGQINYELLDGLKITAGGRYGWQTNDFDNQFYRTNADFERTSLVYSVAGLTYDDNDFSPKIGIDYQFSPYWLGYVSWTRGSKAGGFNRSASTAQIANLPVRPETVTTYEAGLKGRTANNVFQATLTGFYNDFKEYQATITNPTVDGQIIVGNVVANAAEATTYGAEFEGTLRPVSGLEARFAAAYLETRFDSFANPTGAAATDYTGNELPYSPRWIFSGDINYTLPLKISGKLSIRGTVDYSAKTFGDVANRVAVQIPEQLNVNLGANYRTGDGLWEFQLLVRNLLNREEVIGYRSINASLGTDSAKFSAPRMVTLGVRRNF